MHNMGWWSKMGWYLRELVRILEEYRDEMPENMERDFRQAINYYRLSFNLIGRMDSRKALKHLKKIERYDDPYFTYNARRLFYEYLGHTPLAYKYLIKAIEVAPEGTGILWEDCRKAFLLMCAGRDPASKGIEIERCENRELVEQINEGLEMTALVRSHILSCAAVVGVREPKEIAEDILKNVKMGMEKNYDHITLRILTAFIPVLFSIGKGTLARGLVRSAIYTSRTERNRYMYEWFSLYDRAIQGRTEGLKRRIKVFAGRKYVIHEIIARRVAYRLGVNPDENLKVSREKARKYGGVCYERMVDLIFEGGRP